MGADRFACGTIFNIQKFCVNDGPGIRTTVFLKGCPLRCPWCANPESQLARVQVLHVSAKCFHCGHCREICPAGAVDITEGRVRIDQTKCTACGTCVRECPGHAMETEGEQKTVQQVLDIVLQDRPFYEESGGGLTLSGGEFLMQFDFSRNLLLGAKEEELHTCCETTGFIDPMRFGEIIQPLDTLLFDMKHWDADAHRRATGVSNELPLQNMKAAVEAGKDVLPRIPVIPGFNNALSDAEGFTARLHEIGAKRCQLLPFHQFGENKYDLLGKDYRYRDVPALHQEDLESYLAVFRQNGIEAFF
ncbi:MAG: glycyl-radical enzyme activating protein [Oscillospiraceae bacterium]|nr:glycyl-radical enzyme activating protein [Oscillospiraceae bacterium]